MSVVDETCEMVVGDLRALFGSRLVDVLVYGSRVREDAHPDSDLDLAVVLDEMDAPWQELRRMDEILWRATLRSGITVTATPVALADWQAATVPFLRSVREEARRVA